MKMIQTIGALVLPVMMSLGAAAQTSTTTTSQTEQLTVPLSEPGKPYRLNVDLVYGSIKIVGYEGKDIVIDAESGDKRKSRERDRDKDDEGTNVNVNINTNISGSKGKESTTGMKKLTAAGSGLDLSAQEKANRVTINSNSWMKAVHLVIKVPANGATLKLSTVNNGDITVSNINGELEVNNTNGAVTLTNVSGSVVANTVNGSMIVSFKSVDPKAPMAFTTLNGKVDVTFPADVKVNIKAKSDRGEVYSDFDVDVDKTAPKVTRSTEKGLYKLNVEDWIQGKINGGGPETMMKTMNGNIYIRKAK
jgi:ribosomal protein S11